MVNKCVAFGCKSGYSSNAAEDATRKITFHSFPKDNDQRDKWIRANPRKDFVPSKISKICSLHFADSDFIVQRTDSKDRRRRKHGSELLTYRYLKKDAVPSIFQNVPSYLSTPSAAPRSTAATSTRRLELEAEELKNYMRRSLHSTVCPV